MVGVCDTVSVLFLGRTVSHGCLNPVLPQIVLKMGANQGLVYGTLSLKLLSVLTERERERERERKLLVVDKWWKKTRARNTIWVDVGSLVLELQ